MKRIMFDTSVYGRLAEEKGTLTKVADLIPSRIVIYGTKIIRSELRATPPNVKEGKKSKRIILLNIYDTLIGNHDLKYNRLVDTLANDYFIEYKNLGGGVSNEHIRNDLIIVATATIYNLDIVVSSDRRTMIGKSTVSAYKKVNKNYGLSDPEFLDYDKFKERLRRKIN